MTTMKKIIILALGLLLSTSVFAISEDELLAPEQAFAISGKVVDANTVAVEWKVADGYYLYDDKFSFASTTPGIELGDVQIPAGKKKFDPIFEKELETHRHSVVVTVPLIRNDESINNLQLKVGSQGCADVGVCYPPMQQTLSLDLPKPVKQTAAVGGLEKLTSLGDSLGLGGQQEFLPPDEAFAFTTELDANGNIIADWRIAKGYYLYRDKFSFKSDTAGVQLAQPDMPKGTLHHGILPDGSEGEVEVYTNNLTLIFPVDNAPAAGTLSFTAKFQGCADAGICYPPMTKTNEFTLTSAIAKKPATTQTAPVETTDTEKKTYLGYIIAAFGIGLLLTFTPCVLPMIPILSSIIVGQSQDGQLTKLKGGMLSFSYVLGTSVVYTAAGWAAGASGKQLQAYFQNPYVIGSVSTILVVLALSMFGLFTIQMPSGIQSRLQARSSGIKGGSMIGVFIMGVLSSMIVGACASPVLLSVLGVAIKSQDPVLGALIMFFMSLGMGVILIAIGIGAGAIIPRAGTWMDSVKYFFGVLLIGVAIYVLTVIPAVPVLLLWGIFFIVLAIYMGATQSLSETAGGWQKFWKGIGTVLLIWGVLSLLGSMQGNRDPLQPVDFSKLAVASGSHGATTEAAHVTFTKVKTNAELDSQLAQAKAAGKPVMIDFFATWCTDCLRMEKSTFSDPAVIKRMKEFVALQVDVTDPSNEETSAVQKRLGVFAPPAILFYDSNGNSLKDKNFYGFKDAKDYSAHIASIK